MMEEATPPTTMQQYKAFYISAEIIEGCEENCMEHLTVAGMVYNELKEANEDVSTLRVHLNKFRKGFGLEEIY